MRKHRRVPSYVVALAAAAACAGNHSAGPRTVDLVAPFQAGAGESVTVNGTPLSILVEGINDSRCPSDVTCITAGDAVVALRLAGDARGRADTLHTSPARGMSPGVTYGGYRVLLEDVLPHPVSTARDRVPVARLRVISWR